MIETATSLSSIVAEQAIFTSVRSPMGEGYRIIAASPGLRNDERSDITRRCPSHGSLYQEGPGSVALMAFPLTSGRYCVTMSYDGGAEHTSRGGCRVYTHMVVLDHKVYQQFGSNAVRMHAAIRQTVGDTPQLTPQTKLPQLTWALVPTRLDLLYFVPHPAATILGGALTAADPRARIEAALHISLGLLRGEKLFVTGIEDEYDLLEKAIVTLPMKLRRTLAVSVGLKHSPMRQLSLCFAAPGAGDAQRGLRGQRMRWFDAAHPLSDAPSGYEAWINLLRRWLAAGRNTEVEKLTSSITNDASPAALARVAALCNDVDELDENGPANLVEIITRYERFKAASEFEVELIARIKARADHSRASAGPSLPAPHQRPMPGGRVFDPLHRRL